MLDSGDELQESLLNRDTKSDSTVGTPHDDKLDVSCKDSAKIAINIGGQRFVTFRSTLQRLPDTRLASLSPQDSEYDATEREYFFDRNPRLFPYILDGLRVGKIHFPHCNCAPAVKAELLFWMIPDELIASCCWRAYKEYEEEERTLKLLDCANERTARLTRQVSQPNISRWQRMKTKLLLFLEEPNSSFAAAVWSYVYVVLLGLSVGTLVLGTEQAWRVSVRRKNKIPFNTTNPKMNLYWDTSENPVVQYTGRVVIYIFMVELVLRFIVWPTKCRFLLDSFNFIDTVSVVPLTVVTTVDWVSQGYFIEHGLVVVRLVVAVANVFRTFRILKIMNHNKGLRVLLLALYASMREMLLLLLLVVIGMLIFSTTIYYAEFDRHDAFESIPRGFWWSIITMTTVGYGDVYPTTSWGHLVGGMCAVTGILITSLPIPIIASKFNLYYAYAKVSRHRKERKIKIAASIRKKVKESNQRLLQGCRYGAQSESDV